MQLFTCPFCGDRDEREFFFAGESGKVRPNTTQTVTEQEWADYLHTHRNVKGTVSEIWMHLPCSEVFQLTRDSNTMTVNSSQALRKAPR